jgi:hypothetical protein
MGSYDAMLRHLKAALKPDRRLVIVEPIAEKHRAESREEQMRVHEIAVHFVEQEARDAGFRIQRLQGPFTVRRDTVEWMLVAVPDPLASAQGPICPLPSKTSAASSSSASEDEPAGGCESRFAHRVRHVQGSSRRRLDRRRRCAQRRRI